MKVYVVTKYKDIRYNHEEEVHKVFSTQEKADNYIKEQYKPSWYFVEEMEVE